MSTNTTFDQIAAELSLSGMALTMARCAVLSADQWRRGELGTGVVETHPGDLAERRTYMMDPENIAQMVHTVAADILGVCRRGKEYPRDLTAGRLAEALLLVIP